MKTSGGTGGRHRPAGAVELKLAAATSAAKPAAIPLGPLPFCYRSSHRSRRRPSGATRISRVFRAAVRFAGLTRSYRRSPQPQPDQVAQRCARRIGRARSKGPAATTQGDLRAPSSRTQAARYLRVACCRVRHSGRCRSGIVLAGILKGRVAGIGHGLRCNLGLCRACRGG